jgi:hypothetical protein
MKRTAAPLSERAALARIERILEQAIVQRVEAAEPAIERNQSPTERASADQGRIDKWIRDRLVDWRDSCWLCRKPIIAGQLWTVVSNGGLWRDFIKTVMARGWSSRKTLAQQAPGLDRSAVRCGKAGIETRFNREKRNDHSSNDRRRGRRGSPCPGRVNFELKGKSHP